MTAYATAQPPIDSHQLPATTGVHALSPSGSGGLSKYLNTIKTFSLLTPEQEADLFEKYLKHGDSNAAQQLILANLRFVVHIARKYRGYGLPLQDLIQEGNIGLMRAVHKFDPSYGVRLISFAAYWIKAEIHEFIMRNWRIVKVSTTSAQRRLFFKLRSLLPQTQQASLTKKEAGDIAEKLDVSSKDVLEMETRMQSRDVSLDEHLNSSEYKNATDSTALLNSNETPEQTIEDEDWNDVVFGQINHKLQEMDERSQDIIRQRWIGEEKTTLESLANKYSVSIERIRQIEKTAMQKLKKHLESNGCRI